MGPRRPPDILRKSHAHTERKPRARDKAELRDALNESATAAVPDRGLLIDLDGVVFRGDDALAGAADAVSWLRDEGIPYLFVSNTATSSRQALVDKLAAFGIDAKVDDILVPASAAAARFSADFFDAVASTLGTPKSATWIIGDEIRADVGDAQAAGLKGILVRTGKYRDGDLDLGIKPELVIDSIADLPRLWS